MRNSVRRMSSLSALSLDIMATYPTAHATSFGNAKNDRYFVALN